MAKKVFKALTSGQSVLFPSNISDMIPQNHPVRLVDRIVDSIDISSIIADYKGGGTSSYSPRMMLKVLFYSYLNNVKSCRKIEKALGENIYFMWISGNSCPDFRTINNFRSKRLKDSINTLFAEVVKLLNDLGCVSLDVQYIDGTKIESASNRYTFVWKKSVEKHKARLDAKIQSVLKEIEEHVKADNLQANTEELPEDLNADLLKERLEQLNSKIKEETLKKKINEVVAELPRLKRYETQLEKIGDRNSLSKTDEDATFMRMKEDHMKNGQLKPAYNVQVSSENQFITKFSIHQKPGDTTTLIPHLEEFSETYETQSKVVVADAGYGSEENYEYMEGSEIEAYVKYNYFHKEQKRAFKKDIANPQNLYFNEEKDFFVCPMGQKMEKTGVAKRKTENGYLGEVHFYTAKNCSNCPLRGICHNAKGNRVISLNKRLKVLKNKAKERLLEEQGIKYRKLRAIEPEAVFAQIKWNNNFTRFSLRGLKKVQIEFGLVALAHNLRKLIKKAG
jgi:transposase